MAASIENIILQMILSAFRSAKMTSASKGWVNRFIGLENAGVMGVMDVEGEIETAILELISNQQDRGDDTTKDSPFGELDKAKSKTNKEKQAARLASQARTLGTNPMAAMIGEALPLLPHTVLVALALSLAPFIFDVLTRPGGPLDLRFKRIVDDEINAFLSRQSQKDTQMGFRPVIIQAKKGFTASNGLNHFNTTKGIREGGLDQERLDRLDMKSHAKGVFDF